VLATLKVLTGLALGIGDVEFETIPSTLRPTVRAYAARLASTPKDRLHLEIFEGMYTLPAAERRFVTPDAIRATTLVGTRDDVRARIAAVEAAGVTQLARCSDASTTSGRPRPRSRAI
jgi:alkanesulfonate monooxygenase SsuD/methylene tetrahydromethanopterin reductase-like flavin-dependent oxidoreductase (luciferase family)